MPVTSHFRTDAEALLPNEQWLAVVVDLNEEYGDLVIESNYSSVSKPHNTENEVTTQLSSPSHSPSYRTTSDNIGSQVLREDAAASIRKVEVNKGEEGLGVSIKGGADHHIPITISKIFRGMAADRTRQLFVGDSIISVNGISLKNATHEEAVKALRSAGHQVMIEVQYLPAIATSPARPVHSKPPLSCSETLPPLGEIGWGPLTTMSPVKQPEANGGQPLPKANWWRRVCSLRLAGVRLLQDETISQGSTNLEDTSNRVVSIHSADLAKTINLRFSSPPIAGCWLNWLCSVIDRQGILNYESHHKCRPSEQCFSADRFRDRANDFFAKPSTTIAMNSQMPYCYPGQFWQVGWLDSLVNQQLFTEPSPEERSCQWQRVFAVVTDKDFLMFDRAPSLTHDNSDAVFKAAVGTWLSKHEIARMPLIFSRLVSNQNEQTKSGNFNEMASSVDPGSRHLLFGLRVARLPPRVSSPVVTSRDTCLVPIEWRTFRCVSLASLSNWCRATVAGSHRSVGIVSALRFAVYYSGRLCFFELSEDSISLYDVENTQQPLYWSKPLSALCSSSDDGVRVLYLDLQGIGTVDLEMATEADILANSKESAARLNCKNLGLITLSTPKPIVFALHSFLSAKLASLGIVA